MLATLFCLSVPAIASADPIDHRDQHRYESVEIARLRADIQRREMEIARDRREHRYRDMHEQERMIERDRRELERLMWPHRR
jgi:hypothetical protein